MTGQRLPSAETRPETITSTDLLRHFIGIDPLSRLQQNTGNYPPHNIEQITEDRFHLTLAVAGFKKDEIDVSLSKGFLTISGQRSTQNSGTRTYLYRGIGTRDFVREFKLGENVEVTSANLEDGLLEIVLDRVTPEDEHVKRIPIGSPKA